ncbi:MAG: hypothetical protein M3004_03860 [Bacteroidota bacterium]|nr:hypothetical protein [Bacteroidota bacterium]
MVLLFAASPAQKPLTTFTVHPLGFVKIIQKKFGITDSTFPLQSGVEDEQQIIHQHLLYNFPLSMRRNF